MLNAVGRHVKAGWKALGIDWKVACLMFKGSVPVAISLGIYQSTAVSEVYTSLGFLVSIIAVVTVNILPRAELIQMTFTICVMTALAIPVSMLATWSGLQARFHTDPQGLHDYNSSQSAITGVWLFFNILVCNSIQARYPHLMIPGILYNIFVIVQFTSCSRFSTWQECWDLIYLTIRCYYTGVAISFVSGLIIYPVTCRTEIFEVQEEYIEAVRDMLKKTSSYLRKLETTPTFPTLVDGGTPIEDAEGTENRDGAELQKKMAGVKALYIKMHKHLAMAKQEIAWGKLRADDIGHVSDLCRRILMPLGGIAHMPEILKGIEESGGWMPYDVDSGSEDSDDDAKSTRAATQEAYESIWRQSVGALIEPAVSIIEATEDGLVHAALQLEIIPRPGSSKGFNWLPGTKRTDKTDHEAEGVKFKPGDPEFSRCLEEKLNEFSAGRTAALTAWAESKGLSSSQLEKLQAFGLNDKYEDPVGGHPRRDQQQLYLILYMEQMLYTTAIAVLELSKFADKIVAEGIMSKKRLIVPSWRRLYRWLTSIFDTPESALADDDRPSSKKEAKLLYGNTRRATHNIEHLPPRNAYERLGTRVRAFQDFLKGPELAFGFRSACATMACGILAYLHQTQFIFTHYRLIWTVIISAIGANVSAGQSGVSYVLRILGSLMALLVCYLVWYIPDGHVAGVIVFMWLAAFIEMYFIIKWPKYIIGWLVVLITEVLSIGYELEVAKIGIPAATSTGTYFYYPYSVAAMRVACVLWATVVSIIFTYLPYPITARGFLRKDMAVVMHLLSNYHAVVHATIKARLRGTEGDPADKHSRGHVLAHTRKAMFNKIMLLTASVQHSVYLQKYEPTLGGRFPVAIFEDILSQLTVLLDYISLLSYTTQVWAVDGHYKGYFHYSSASRQWLSDLATLIGPMAPTEERIATILYQLSAAVSTGRPFGAKIKSVKTYQLSQKLRELDPEVLHIRHMTELGYSTYAVSEIISTMVSKKVDVLVQTIESLVGIASFDVEEVDDDEQEKME